MFLKTIRRLSACPTSLQLYLWDCFAHPPKALSLRVRVPKAPFVFVQPKRALPRFLSWFLLIL